MRWAGLLLFILTHFAAKAEAPTARAVKQSLAAIEIGGISPFAGITEIDRALGRGVTDVERQTLRSAIFREDVGYDVALYRISHPDHTTSTFLAWFDQAPVALVINDGHAFLYRGEDEPKALSLEEAGDLVDECLAASVPLLTTVR